MTTNPKRYLIIGLLGLAFLPSVFADDGSGCDDYKTTNFQNPSWSVYCYVEEIYHQNKVLIQEQNQTNHLLAVQICEKDYFTVQYPDDGTVNGKDLTSCINHMLGVSR